MIKKSLVLSAALSLAMVGGASAASFTTQEALAFGDCLAPMNDLARAFEKEGTAEDLFSNDTHELVVDGKLKPYSVPLESLKESDPAAYKRVDKVAASCNLDNAERLGGIADGVMAAYMAKRMPPMSANPMAGLPPGMLENMPPEAKKGLLVMQAMQNVSEEEKALITPEVEAKIDANIGEEMGEADFSAMGSMNGMPQ